MTHADTIRELRAALWLEIGRDRMPSEFEDEYDRQTFLLTRGVGVKTGRRGHRGMAERSWHPRIRRSAGDGLPARATQYQVGHPKSRRKPPCADVRGGAEQNDPGSATRE